MISKELLSEVMQLGILEVGEVNDCYLSFKYYILDDDCIDACINIYELAHKCKEWAHKKEYYVNSGQMDRHSGKDSSKWFATIFNPYGKIGDERSGSLYGKEITRTIFSDSEVEAIIKACEWIRKEINK